MDDSKRCTATSHRTGKRCGLARIPGTTVCATHGGKAPQVKEAAAARVADAEARELARKMDVDVAQFDGNPFEALGNLLARDQAEMERFARLAARLEDDQLTYTTRGGVEQLRAVLSAYQSERDAMGRRLDLMLRAGIAERLAQTREGAHKTSQGGLLALFGMCMNLFLSDVSSALCDAGAYEQHDAVMEAVQRRVRFRLQHENSMIIRQIENLASSDRRSREEPQ
jgi:hypothetical protein